MARTASPTRTASGGRLGMQDLHYYLSYPASLTAYTDLGSSVLLNSAQPWAISAWVNLENFYRRFAGAQGLFSFKTDQGVPFVFYMQGNGISNSTTVFKFGAASLFNSFVPTNAPAFFNKINRGWHKLMITFDGVARKVLGSYKMYIDGADVPLSTAGLPNASSHLNTIGVLGATFAGMSKVSQLRIWNGGTALTATDALNDYLYGQLPTGATLTRNFSTQEGSGTTLTDSVGGNNGTINGAVTWGTDGPFPAPRTAVPSFRIPVVLVELGITNLWTFRGGVDETYPLTVLDEIGGFDMVSYGAASGEDAYVPGSYKGLLDFSIQNYFSTENLNGGDPIHNHRKFFPANTTSFSVFVPLSLSSAGLAQESSVINQSENDGTARKSFDLKIESDGKISLVLTQDGTTEYVVRTTSAVLVAADVDYFVEATYDSVVGVKIYVNGSSVPVSVISGTLPSSVFSTGIKLNLGAFFREPDFSEYQLGGTVGVSGVAKGTAHTAAQALALYNIVNGVGSYI